MNTKFIMDVLKNPQQYTKDQQKIAVAKAIDMLNNMGTDASQPENAADACTCRYPHPPATNKFEGMVCDACGKKRAAD